MTTAANPSRPGLSSERRREFAGLILLDRVITQERAFHAGLLDDRDDELLNPIFEHLLAQGLAEIGADDYYRATDKGHRAYDELLRRQQVYRAHFDLYAYVDLAQGAFADPEHDLLEDRRWSDLRVAVAERKGIDPYLLVFIALLAEGRFFQERDWKADLAADSGLFTELQQIVTTQLTVADLAYTAEDGTEVSGEAVLDDVIAQGEAIVSERREAAGASATPVPGWNGGEWPV
jgi:hypothetical protein